MRKWTIKLKKQKIDYLSIHDCVVVKESDVEIAMRVLKTISNQFKGIRFKKKQRLELIELLENLNEIYYSGEIWRSEKWDTDRHLTLIDKWNRRVSIKSI